MHSADVSLDAGWHYIGVKATNDVNPDPNPAAFICTVYRMEGSQLGDVMIRTRAADDDWFVIDDYPAQPPGFTPAEIMETLVDEAQTRGALAGVTVDEADAGTEVEFTVGVGVDYLSVLKQLTDSFCDFRIAPGGTAATVLISTEAGDDLSGTIELEPAVNLAALDHQGTVARQSNALLVRYQNGYIESADEDSVDTWTRKEGFLSLGTDPSEDQVQTVAASTLAELAQPEVSTTAAPNAATGPFPFVDFNVGDWITAPDETGTPASVRVVAVTADEDVDGVVTFTPELSTVRQQHEERQQRWMKRMQPGTLGGASESAAPTLPVPAFADYVALPPAFSDSVDVAPDPYDPGQVPTWDDDLGQFVPGDGGGGGGGIPPFSFSGLLAVSTSPRWYAAEDMTLTEAKISLQTAGTASSVIRVRKNGSTSQSFTMTSGTTVNTFTFTTLTSITAGDYIDVAVTTAAAAAKDLDVQIS